MNRAHREMTEEEIDIIISDFVAAAVRAQEAGFDAVQFHGAHGYLMSQFISPLFNHRTDRWGGSAENRRRFHIEVTKKVRQAIGNDFPLMIKFGIQDDREKGLSLDEGVVAAKKMEQQGMDAIEVSAGVGAAIQALKEDEPERIYFRERASTVRKAVNVPIILVGGIRSLEMAQDIMDSGDADMVSMCRPFIREPGLVARWQAGDKRPAKCISCSRCMGVVGRGEPLECGEERRLREKTAADA
jgi:2,4-dienoyl-CoA reductase-like NADH-dependent reductase (Old Yellow Enzyme family)